MKVIHISWDEIAVGADVTIHHKPKGYSGQGGIVRSVTPEAVHLVCGTAKIERTLLRADTHHVTQDVPFDADECLEYGADECAGPVELFAPGNGNAFPRCRKHRERRAKSYETSMERYADSDVEPDWFDPANAGEHWGYDY